MTKRDDVQAAFGDMLTIDAQASIYAFGDVWRARVHGGDEPVPAVVKRTWTSSPHALEAWERALVAHGIRTVAPLLPIVEVDADDRTEHWVAYPWLEGREWDGGSDDLVAAGRLLGHMHTASHGLSIEGFSGFEWGSDERSSIDEDVAAIEASAAEHWPHADTSRWTQQLEGFGELLARMHRADLPMLPASLDHRAANVLFDDAGALALDLENAAFAPRVFDLAIAALLWPLEHPGAGGSALGSEEWAAFLSGYRETAPALTAQEQDAWPEALTYMKLEWGTWHLTECVEAEPEGNLAYLEDLLTLDEHARFPLR